MLSSQLFPLGRECISRFNPSLLPSRKAATTPKVPAADIDLNAVVTRLVNNKIKVQEVDAFAVTTTSNVPLDGYNRLCRLCPQPHPPHHRPPLPYHISTCLNLRSQVIAISTGANALNNVTTQDGKGSTPCSAEPIILPAPQATTITGATGGTYISGINANTIVKVGGSWQRMRQWMGPLPAVKMLEPSTLSYRRTATNLTHALAALLLQTIIDALYATTCSNILPED